MPVIRTALAAALTAVVCLVAPPATAADSVTVAGQTRVLNGTNVYRATNYLVLYTPARGATTGTNVYGYEAVVIDGKVTRATDGVGNTAIPANGVVLSGHGTSRTWLKTYAKVGASVTLPGAPPPPPPSAPPTADLVLNPASGPAPLVTTADGSGSKDDVGVTSYRFAWGDGTQTAAQVASTATHTYEAVGSYVVTLTVTDNDGHVASTTRTATVTAVDPPPTNQPPVARLTATPASGAAPLSVVLDGGASTDDTGITGYTFDFGDGSSTVSQPASSAQHSYAAAGTYTASLTVRDQEGATSSATASVTVTSPPPPPPPPGEQVVVSVTFDDTYANQVLAADVLARYGMKGTFYVNSPRLGSGSSTYMSKAQVDHLVAAGHEIGGHTLSHVDLAKASSSEATRQVCDDRAALLGMGYRVTSFAYPFGSTSAAAKQIVAGCGYNSARGVGDLRSPGYGCDSCATADTIPPADKLQIKTNQSVQSDTTLAMLENYVTQAESDRGGWVPLLIHQV